jgi:hypothetical protein
MKTRGLIVCFVVILIGIAVPTARSSSAAKTLFFATEAFDPLGLFGAPVGELVEPGSVRCPSFEPTGNPLQPCQAASRTQIRGLTLISRIEASDPRLSGWLTIVASANWDSELSGPGRATFLLAADNAGTWDGICQGTRQREVSSWSSSLHCTGHGTEGTVKDLQVAFEENIISFTPVPLVYFGAIEGRILEHN